MRQLPIPPKREEEPDWLMRWLVVICGLVLVVGLILALGSGCASIDGGGLETEEVRDVEEEERIPVEVYARDSIIVEFEMLRKEE